MWAFYCNNSCCGISDQNLVMASVTHLSRWMYEETFVTRVFPAPVFSCANLRDSVCCTSSCDFRQFHSMANYCYVLQYLTKRWAATETSLISTDLSVWNQTANAVWWLHQTAFAHDLSKPLQPNLRRVEMFWDGGDTLFHEWPGLWLKKMINKRLYSTEMPQAVPLLFTEANKMR